MFTPAAHVLVACTPDELRRDFGDWIATTSRTFPERTVERWRRALPSGPLDLSWRYSAPTLSGLQRELGAAAACVSHVLLVAVSAAERLRQELPPRNRLPSLLERLLQGQALGDPSRLTFVFDDRLHPCLGLIADEADRRAWSTRLHRVAIGNVPVLITGETGTGKELIARALQRFDRNRPGPWIAVNCAAFPEGLLESELFGHVRGAFTGATADRAGLFEAADGGTLFLDEIGELPHHVQAKLLRTLEDRRIRPLGSSRTRCVDCRIVVATNRNLRVAVERNQFRPDLYHRLRGVEITLPSLRDRPRLLRPAVESFLARAFFRFGRRARLSDAAQVAIGSHSWPGNFRELRQVVDGAVLSAAGETIGPSELGLPLEDGGDGASLPTVDVLERAHILRALDATEGNVTAAARILGLTRQSLRRRLFRHGLLTVSGTAPRRPGRTVPDHAEPAFVSNGTKRESSWSF